MTNDEALEYIHSLHWKGKKDGLTKISKVLELLGHPEKQLNFVHVAGTNGKGSTCVMLAHICKEAGYRVGLYTSPFIVRFHERIQVDLKEISENELAELTETVKNVTDGMDVPPSEFEVVTVIGLLYFVKKKCDLVILETGLGGTWDATNVIPAPILAIITAIDFDHMAQLGTSIRDIAAAKAGIIKNGSEVLFYGENQDAEQVIRTVCEEKNCELSMPVFDEIKQIEAGLDGQCFSYKAYKAIRLRLLGIYQQKNAALVLEAVELLKKKGYCMEASQVKRGLEKTEWMARFECLSEKPYVILDGSHNPQGMRATMETIRKTACGRMIRCVFGVMADKDVSDMLSVLLEFADEVTAVTPEYPRALSAKELYQKLTDARKKSNRDQIELFCENTVSEGMDYALSRCGENDVLLAIGSLYMAGEVKKYMEERK